MAYVALYRAYRPKRFNEVVGQEHIIKTLQNAITLNKVAHAYLFCGPRGTGKTTLAKIMAMSMNCENGPLINPPMDSEICSSIAAGTMPDVIEIDAASNNGADDIRALRDTVKYLPAVGKYKVYIIDEVHMLSNAAFNALLKTLEEPPKHVIFILATTEPYKLPKTILSRCQRFDFSSISIDEILKRLHIVASEENVKISEEALHQIAISAEGGMRDALSIFDQSISYSVSEEITLDDVLAISGNISYLSMISLLNNAIDGNSTECIKEIDEIIKKGKEIPRIINDLILFLRDTLMFKNNAIIEDKLMYTNKDFISLAGRLNKGVIYSWLDILNEELTEMRFSTQKRAYLELAMLKMSDTKLNEESNLRDRLESLEQSIIMLQNERNSRPQNNNYNMAPRPQNTVSFMSNEELMRLRNEPQNQYVPQAAVYNEPVMPKPQEPVYENEVKTEVKQEIVAPVIPENANLDDYIKVSDISEILNNASKDKKEALAEVLKKIEENYVDFTMQKFVRGKLVAVSDDKFVISLADASFATKLMQYQSYVKIMEAINEYNPNIKDYICITHASWDIIQKDFRSKYTKENPHPVLDEFNLGIKKRVIPSMKTFEKSEDDKIIDTLKETFGEDLEIVEE